MDSNVDRILVVEDNATNRRILQHMLSKLHVSTDYAENGLQAVEMVASKQYACILMDMMMPVMDGLGASQQIRSQESGSVRTPIVALTANSDPSYERKCLDAGMDAFLSKPFTFDQLSGVLDRVIDRPPRREERHAINKAILSTFVRTMGEDDTAFLKELFNEFLNQANQVRSEIHAGMNARDGGLIAREVHSLRGSSAVIGAESLASICQEIEQYANRDLFSEVELRLSRFEGSINQVRYELDRFMKTMPETRTV